MMQTIDFKGKEMAVSQGFEPFLNSRQPTPTQENQQLTISTRANERQQKPTFRHQNDTRKTHEKNDLFETFIYSAFWFLVLLALTDPIFKSGPLETAIDFDCAGPHYLHPDCPNPILEQLKESK